MIKYTPKIKKPKIGQINAKKEPQAETPAAFFDISTRISYGIIINQPEKKSKSKRAERPNFAPCAP